MNFLFMFGSLSEMIYIVKIRIIHYIDVIKFVKISYFNLSALLLTNIIVLLFKFKRKIPLKPRLQRGYCLTTGNELIR